MTMELQERLLALSTTLIDLIGRDQVVSDASELEFYSADVYSRGETASLAITPVDPGSLPAAIGACTEAGFAVIPRGGGMSYTSGYTPVRKESVIVDMSGLNSIVEVNASDMYITVEAGVTWKQIYSELRPQGLRLPFFGTFSGARATVGGGMSNGALFMGTGRYGTAAEIVLGLQVIAADGTVIRTGQAAFRNGRPFYRTYGPDLTGLFIHDAGALGIKTEVSLRLMQTPSVTEYASYVFPEAVATAKALSAIARADVAEEVYVFDPETTRHSLDGGDLRRDLGRLANVIRDQSSLIKGIAEGARLVGAGRRFIADDVYSLHVVCSGRTEEGVTADLAVCDRIVSEHGGGGIENSIPKAARANPFEPLNTVIGVKGDRWAALNCKVAHSDADELIDRTDAILSEYQDRMNVAGVTISRLFVAISNHAFSFEPVFRWFDEWLPVHRRTPEPEYLNKIEEPASNPAAQDLICEMRQRILDLFAEMGAASNQIGKTYPYYSSLNEDTAALVRSLKRSLDPKGLMNPGALGIPVE